MARKPKKPRRIFATKIRLLILFVFIICCAYISSSVIHGYVSKDTVHSLENQQIKKPTLAEKETKYENTLTGIDNLVYRTWKKRIEEVGPTQAYKEFKSSYKNINSNWAHDYLHIFGSILYLKFDLNGISVCDNTFAYACYHSFIAKAIQEHGIEAVITLNNQCQNKLATLDQDSHGCQHGIGHGLLSYYGYTLHSLEHALKDCQGLTDLGQTSACDAGVYMEYDYRTMLLDEGVMRVYHASNPYEPCDKLSYEYQYQCYFWHGQWLFENMKGSVTDRFKAIGKICSAIDDQDNKVQCFGGAGHFVGQYIYWNIPNTVKACNVFTVYGKDIVTECLAAAKETYMSFGMGNVDELYDGPPLDF